MNIAFKDKEHERFYFESLEKCRINDEYHRAFFYVIGISDEAKRNIGQLFNFEEDLITPEGLYKGWQTDSSKKSCILAFNLWNGFTDEDDISLYTPENIFCCMYANYFAQGIKLRFPAYFKNEQ